MSPGAPPEPLPRPCYADLSGWERYQDYYPPAMRCASDATPTEEWWPWSGLHVHLDRCAEPASPIKVIVLHGAGAYGRILAPASAIARRHGWETVCPDLPGCGLTSVPRDRFVYALWVDCIVDLVEAELARDGRPVVLFGVSLGGALAYHVAARSRRVVGVVTTTLADPRDPEVRERLARRSMLGTACPWLLDTLRAGLDGVPVPIRYLARMEAISNRPEFAALSAGDPLGGGAWVPARFLRTLLSTAPALEPERFRVCPVLLTQPGADRMTGIAPSRRFFDRIAGPKRMVVLEGASHVPTEQPGLDQMVREVVKFLGGLA